MVNAISFASMTRHDRGTAPAGDASGHSGRPGQLPAKSERFISGKPAAYPLRDLARTASIQLAATDLVANGGLAAVQSTGS